MANGSEVIKEFLVAVGVKIDEGTLSKFEDIIGSIGAKVLVMAASLGAAALATEKFVDKVTSNLEDLYWASKRLHSGVADIQDYGLAIKNLGGTAEGARGSLENLARNLRLNPGYGGLLQSLGVDPGQKGGAVAIAKNLAVNLKQRGYPYYLAARYAEKFGIDELTFLSEWNAKPGDLDKGTYKKAYASVGINADAAAKTSHDFQVQLRDIGVQFEILAVNMASHLLPAMRALNNEILKHSGGAQSGVSTLGDAITAPLKWKLPGSWGEAWNNTKSNFGNAIMGGFNWLRATGIQQSFQGMGWDETHARAITAALMAESKGDPRAENPKSHAQGIAQWLGSRKEDFKKFAGVDLMHSSIDQQMKFVNYELTQGKEKRVGKMLREAKNFSSMVDVMVNGYLKPGTGAAGDISRAQHYAGVTINQKTTIHVAGGATSGATGAAVAGQQKRVNGDLVRNLKSVVQ